MAPEHRIGIVGLGLIGGSLAKAFRRSFPASWIVAADRKPAVLAAALADGVLDLALLFPAEGAETPDPFEGFASCGFVFVCTPVDITPATVARVTRYCPGIVSDVGSCKTAVMRGVADLPPASRRRFLGGHPMAGSERVGYAASRANLFENAIYVLCLPVSDDPAVGVDADALTELVTAIGAIPVRLEAEEHDRVVGLVSHLPHVAASALSAVAAREGAALAHPGHVKRLAAGGFRDITRIASSNPDLWAGIATEGAETLRPALDAYIRVLQDFRDQLGSARQDPGTPPDRLGLASLFEEGRAFRDSLIPGARGALESAATLVVQLDDRTGAIARIASTLGGHGIGIRNLGIVNSRGYEGGCLHVLLDEVQLEAARRVLQEAGYEFV